MKVLKNPLLIINQDLFSHWLMLLLPHQVRLQKLAILLLAMIPSFTKILGSFKPFYNISAFFSAMIRELVCPRTNLAISGLGTTFRDGNRWTKLMSSLDIAMPNIAALSSPFHMDLRLPVRAPQRSQDSHGVRIARDSLLLRGANNLQHHHLPTSDFQLLPLHRCHREMVGIKNS